MENFLQTTIILTVIAGLAFLLYDILVYRRTRVPYVTTPRAYCQRLLAELPVGENTVILDLGCGKGDFLFAAEKYNPDTLIGYELSPLPAWYARLKAWVKKSRVEIRRRDFFAADISRADIIYLFLVPPMIERLWPKIKKEAKPGAIVAVLSDKIQSESPYKIIKTKPDNPKSTNYYLYKVK